MSLGKLFLSGLLIAGGLILAAFTLHGYFDPQWAQRQAQAAGARERPKEPKAINTFQGRSRFVASRPEQPSPGARPPAATPAVAANPNAFVKAADTKPAVKSPVKKKVAEKPKPQPQPQQASVWPWNLFSN
jgi:hypothetical protein